jgi:hypothetical protein
MCDSPARQHIRASSFAGFIFDSALCLVIQQRIRILVRLYKVYVLYNEQLLQIVRTVVHFKLL